MKNQKYQAGRNIRKLAFKRRVKSILLVILIILIIIFPLFLVQVLQDFLEYFYDITPSKNAPLKNLPVSFIILYSSFVGITIEAFELIDKATKAWKDANLADQGAKGEEDVAQEILQLVREGWQVEFNIPLGNNSGDGDIFCTSPQNKGYLIDVKSYRGEIRIDSENFLYRQMGNSIYPFDNDLTRKLVVQAVRLREQRNLRFVQAVLVFSDAKVLIPSNKQIGRLYAVEKDKLVSLLKSID